GGSAGAVRRADEPPRRRMDEALGLLEPEIRRAAEHYGFPLMAAVDLNTAPAAAAGGTSAAPAGSTAAAPAGGTSAAEPTAPAAPPSAPTPETVAAGRALFNQLCSHCHSPNAHSPEPSRDLRRLRIRYGERMTAVFYETVTQGRVTKGMPSWKEIVKPDDMARILTFLESVQSSP